MNLETVFDFIQAYPFILRGVIVYVIVGILMKFIRKVFGFKVGRIGGKILFALVTYFIIAMQFKA